jgi:outer membrane protein
MNPYFFRPLSVLVGFLFFATALPSWASEVLKVGILDSNKCLQQSETGKKVFKGLQEKSDRIKKDLDARQEELKKLYEEFVKRRNVLSLDARQEKEKELIRKEEDLRGLTRKKEEEMRKETDSVLQPLVSDLHEIMRKVAKDEGYTLILEGKGGMVYYFTPPVNEITDKVIKLLNETKKEKKK